MQQANAWVNNDQGLYNSTDRAGQDYFLFRIHPIFDERVALMNRT